MGSIRDIANQPKTQSFPSSQYAIAGDVPAAQCTETHVGILFGAILTFPSRLTLAGNFAGFDLAGKWVSITFPPAFQGSYRIASNTDDIIFTLDPFPVDGGPAFGAVHEDGPAALVSDTGASVVATPFLTDPGHWVAGQHDGREVNIMFPAGNVGTYTIIASDNVRLTLDRNLTVTDATNQYTIQNPGQSNLTRNASSFRRFIESQSRSHTTKGAILYTNTPTAEMQNACSVVFAPLT